MNACDTIQILVRADQGMGRHESRIYRTEAWVVRVRPDDNVLVMETWVENLDKVHNWWLAENSRLIRSLGPHERI